MRHTITSQSSSLCLRVPAITSMTAIIAAGLATTLFAAPPAYTIIDFGTLAGPQETTDPGSWMVGLGADGGVVGGSVTNGPHHEFHAFRWIAGSTIELWPLADDDHSVATSTNASGQRVGMSYDLAKVDTHGVRWSADGTAISLNTFLPRRIADDGTIVGQQPVVGSLGVPRAARLVGSSVTDLGTLGGTSSSAADVNAAGWIVGHSALATGSSMRAFLWRNGTMSDLGTLGGASSRAEAINASGQVVGTSQTNTGDPHATLFNLGPAGEVLSRLDLGVLQGRGSSALDIADNGTIVGVSGDRAFRWSGGTLVDLNSTIAPDLSWVLTKATAIDNAGRIAGEGRHFGQRRGFLLVPRNAGDINADGKVDGADIAIVLGNWGPCKGCSADINNDGLIDGADLAIVLGNWTG